MIFNWEKKKRERLKLKHKVGEEANKGCTFPSKEAKSTAGGEGRTRLYSPAIAIFQIPFLSFFHKLKRELTKDLKLNREKSNSKCDLERLRELKCPSQRMGMYLCVCARARVLLYRRLGRNNPRKLTVLKSLGFKSPSGMRSSFPKEEIFFFFLVTRGFFFLANKKGRFNNFIISY